MSTGFISFSCAGSNGEHFVNTVPSLRILQKRNLSGNFHRTFFFYLQKSRLFFYISLYQGGESMLQRVTRLISPYQNLYALTAARKLLMRWLLHDFQVRNAFEVCFRISEDKCNILSMVVTRERLWRRNINTEVFCHRGKVRMFPLLFNAIRRGVFTRSTNVKALFVKGLS